MDLQSLPGIEVEAAGLLDVHNRSLPPPDPVGNESEKRAPRKSILSDRRCNDFFSPCFRLFSALRYWSGIL